MAQTMTTTMNSTAGNRGDQRGFALITALLLLAIMSIVAATLLTSTGTEFQLAAKSRDKAQAIFAADRAIEYAMASLAPNSGTTDLYATHLGQIKITTGGDFPGSLDATAPSTLTVLPERTPPPRGKGFSAERQEMLIYEVNVVGISPAAARNPARVEVTASYGAVVDK